MIGQQLRQASVTIRRTFRAPAIGLSIVAVLIFLALAATLTIRQPVSVPAMAPVMQPAPSESWSPGGHITGSVYDGGAYGARPTP